ncbi:hypothetical protein AG1IA_10343 [Rhizoctonia solani AG-1 IA]|uniref:Uncharacterized protein n=1 Tax=Thanatephorus cucumeris (strain AG1-IA) TaxID=983506 RepID=L8WFX8_THACA|nr:hypothetical protein AG1IA_10343 [Rhizoctonia solani AG-1 IA]
MLTSLPPPRVRVAIYAQTIISMSIASFLPYHEEAFRDTSRSSYIVSTSLMIASLIELKTHGLSLFDALIVTMVSETNLRSSRSRLIQMKFLQLTTIMTAFVTANIAYSYLRPLH